MTIEKKQVTVYSKSAFKLKRSGLPVVEFKAGRNVVDIDVANHEYVKAHIVDAPQEPSENDAELIAAYDKISDLEKQVEDLQAALAAKDADMQALVAAVEADGKGKGDGKKK